MSEPFPTIPAAGQTTNRPPNGEPDIHNLVRYEQKEAWFRWPIILLAVITSGLALMSVSAWLLLQAHETAADGAASKSDYSLPQERLPREPRLDALNLLEGIESADADARRMAMEDILHSYGKTSVDGFVHIPIEQAIKVVADGLPVRHESSNKSHSGFGLLGGGEANSGRVYLEAPPWFGQK